MNPENNKTDYDFIDISKIFSSLWDSKILIIFTSVIFLGIGVIYSLSLPNIYKAESLIISSKDANSGSSNPSGLGGLARLAGVSVQADAGSNKVMIIKTLKSRKFIMNFIKKEGILPEILAVKGMDENGLIYNKSIYDPYKKEWNKEFLKKRNNPSLLEAYEKFVTNNMIIKVDDGDGSMNLYTYFYSPEVAYSWNKKLIIYLNDFMKEKDLVRSNRLVDFYKSSLTESQSSQIQIIIGSLLNETYKELALMDADPEYALSTLDPALMPEKKDSPRRSVIVIFFGFMGLVIACGYAVFRKYLLNND